MAVALQDWPFDPRQHSSEGWGWDETTLGPCLWSWVVAELNSLDLCQPSLSPQEGQGQLSCATLVRDGVNTPVPTLLLVLQVS